MRQLAFATAFIGLFGIIVALNIMEVVENRGAVARSLRPDFTWNNPDTRMTTEINSIWKPSTQQNPGGQIMHVFTEPADRAVVIFAVESAPDLTIKQYVNAFRNNTSASVKFVDSGQFYYEDGMDAWEGHGNMHAPNSNLVHAHILKNGRNFWRIVVVQAEPYAYSEEMISNLKKSLWKTVPR